MADRRAWWHNCAQLPDDEVLAIDRMEDRLGPLSDEARRIRGLIAALEMCHHKAARWVDNVLAAMAGDRAPRGLGSRGPASGHPTVEGWRQAAIQLRAWAGGRPVPAGLLDPAEVGALLGELSPLKRWQVERVAERVAGFVSWAETGDYAADDYVPILEAGEGYVSAPRASCPEAYRPDEAHWRATVEALIHDTEDGAPATIPLAMAIDLLMPCHYNFAEKRWLAASLAKTIRLQLNM